MQSTGAGGGERLSARVAKQERYVCMNICMYVYVLNLVYSPTYIHTYIHTYSEAVATGEAILGSRIAVLDRFAETENDDGFEDLDQPERGRLVLRKKVGR